MFKSIKAVSYRSPLIVLLSIAAVLEGCARSTDHSSVQGNLESDNSLLSLAAGATQVIDTFAHGNGGVNNLGALHSDDGTYGANLRIANNTLSLTGKSGGYFYTMFVDKCVTNYSEFTHVEMLVKAPAGTTIVDLTAQSRDSACAIRAGQASVNLANHVKFNGTFQTVSVPLSAFAGVNLARLDSLVLSHIPVGVKVDFQFIRVVNRVAPPTGGGLLVDSFANANGGTNNLGARHSDDASYGANLSIANNTLSLTGRSGGYFFSNFPEGCVDESAYSYVQVMVKAPAGTAVQVQAQSRNAACNARAASPVVDLQNYVKFNNTFQTVSVPLSAFIGLEKKRMDSLVLTGVSPGVKVEFQNLRLTTSETPGSGPGPGPAPSPAPKPSTPGPAPSPLPSSLPPPSALGPVGSMSLSGATSSSLTVAFTAPVNPSVSVASYKIGWVGSTGVSWVSSAPHYPITISPLVLTGMVPGRSYEVAVTPIYSNGQEGLVTKRSASTLAAPGPGPTTPPAPPPNPGSGVPAKVKAGYLPNWLAGTPRLININREYNMIILFSAHPVGGAPGSTGAVQWNGFDNNSTGIQSNLVADIATVRARGQRVILSIGGAGHQVSLNARARSQAFVTSVAAIVRQLGVDGIDYNTYEGQPVSLTEYTWIGQTLKSSAYFGPNFIITTPPAPWNQNDLAFCRDLVRAGALDLVMPQYYDGPGLAADSYIRGSVTQWGNAVGYDHMIVLFGIHPGGANYGSFPQITNTYNAIKAEHPGIRGTGLWQIWNDINQGYPFANQVRP